MRAIWYTISLFSREIWHITAMVRVKEHNISNRDFSFVKIAFFASTWYPRDSFPSFDQSKSRVMREVSSRSIWLCMSSNKNNDDVSTEVNLSHVPQPQTNFQSHLLILTATLSLNDVALINLDGYRKMRRQREMLFVPQPAIQHPSYQEICVWKASSRQQPGLTKVFWCKFRDNLMLMCREKKALGESDKREASVLKNESFSLFFIDFSSHFIYATRPSCLLI